MMEYTNRHRTFLQAVSNHGAVELDKALRLLEAINTKYEISEAGEEALNSIIQETNAKINEVDQKIVRIKHDVTKKEYVVLANTVESDINKQQFHYDETDREFFRLLLEEITLSEFNIKRIVALNLISKLKPKQFSKSHGEDLIDDWMSSGYFVEHENSIYFGPKVLAEFSDYLARNYPEIVKRCHLCMSAVLMGVQCDDCQESFHSNCLRKALITNLNCPKCKAAWNKPVPT